MSAPAELAHTDGRSEPLFPADGDKFALAELQAIVGPRCEVRRGPSGYVIVCQFGKGREPNDSMPGFVGPVVIINDRSLLHELPDDF